MIAGCPLTGDLRSEGPAGRRYRDGYRVERSGGGAGDLCADIIASHRTRGRVVLQCKHTTRISSIASGDMQRLSGTGRPVHRADTVIALTNGAFPRVASLGNLGQPPRRHPRGRLRRVFQGS
ncbi:restriction endonuclease [Embleya sp. NPDC059237]|uniref:restriction endonuclease n=1 Tax=Embleya sp. NPDC059237 TaxID=3346784 RepID=UPI00368D0187